jgi:hypothetical protein
VTTPIQDFETQLDHTCREAIRRMGRRSATVMDEWAAHGALSNSRIIIALADAFEAEWRELVEIVVADMRAFATATRTARPKLIEAARRCLLEALPSIRQISRMEKPRDGYPARVLSGECLKRVEAAVPYLEMRLRQFELKVGEPNSRGRLQMALSDVSRQTIAGLLVVVIVAAAAAIWSIWF